MRTLRSILLIAITLFASFEAAAVPALPESLSREAIRARLDGLGEGDEAIAALLTDALTLLDRRAELVERASESARRAAEAEPLLAEIREELESPLEAVQPEVAPDATLAQIEQRASEASAELDLLRTRATDLAEESSRRQERRTTIPESIAQARQRLSELDAAPPPEGERTPAQEARAIRDAAERATLEAEVAALQAELAEYDARREVLPARRDRAARRVAQAEQVVEAWQGTVSAARKREAAREADEAARRARETEGQHPVLRAYADQSRELAAQRTLPTGLPQRTTGAADEASAADAALREIRGQYRAVRERIVASGLTRATGLLLRRHYEDLNEGITSPVALRRRAAQVRRDLEDAETLRFEREDARDAYRDIGPVVDDLLDRARSASEPIENEEAARAVARDLASARRDLLTTLQNDASGYATELATLERSLSTLLEAVEAYDAYIRERILWVRSVPRETNTDLSGLTGVVGPLAEGGAWRDAGRAASSHARDRWPALLVGVSLLVLLFVAVRWATARLRAAAERVARFRTDSFAHTLAALAFTAAGALPVAALLYWAGSAVDEAPALPLAGRALGAALKASALTLAPLAFAAGVFREGGLADAHFRWSPDTVRLARRAGRWIVPLAAVGGALLAVSDTIGTDESAATLGRLSFSLFWVVLAFSSAVLARPGGTLSSLIAKRGGWTERTRYLWLPLIPLVPVALVALAWFGYFYTARELAERIAATLAIAGVLMLVNGMLNRWLFVARRRVAVEDAKRRREQSLAEQAEGELPTEGVQAAIDEEKLDLPAISQQTQQLFRAGILVAAIVGFYAVWADTSTALRVLDRVQVYPSFSIAEGGDTETVPILEGAVFPTRGEEAAGQPTPDATAAPPADGPGAGNGVGNATPSPDPGVPGLGDGGPAPSPPVVSLSDVLLSAVLLVATLVAFRNLPGFVEIFVLQRLPLDAGSRYALSTVLRYLIAIIGTAAAFGAIDIGWHNIQWLAAALTFGLAFGLQEIFANFVSGLIILAERPIRIGDTVTIGNVSGTVTRIRMRATTITDWERKELVIPNKNFITGEVINWTLSNPVLRVSVAVGVAYGADVRRAETVLNEIARATPNVLADPEPYVYFKGFGDSTLDFDLRVFLPHVDYWVSVRHDLHMRITEAFRNEGIEIAFPQRDLHIRSAPGLEGLVAEPRDRAGSPAADNPADPREPR